MLKEKLLEDLKDAMKTKNVNKKNAVQMVRTAILQIENMISRILSAFSPKNLSNTEILTCELSLIAMLAVRKDIHTIKTLAISSDHVGV